MMNRVSAVCLLSVLIGTRSPGASPNIVILFADDMGFSDIGCFGSEIQTPNLDRLAENGLRFSHFYNTGRCCPSRASIMTGLYPHQADIGHMAGDAGVTGYRDRLSFNAVTLAEVLRAAGYHTMMTGKWHLGWRDEGCPAARGFQQFYGTRGYIDSYYTIVPRTEVYLNDKLVLPVTENPVNHLHPDQEWYTTDVFTDYALHFIDNVREKDERPFFLYLAYNAPHFPLHAKPSELAKYRGKYTEGWTKYRRQRYDRLIQLGIINKSWPLSPLDVPEWDSLTPEQRTDLDFKMALFAAVVDRLDQNIGRVVNHLQELGELENTLLFFVSDNGGTKETGLFGIKGGNGPLADETPENDEEPPHTYQNYDSWARQGGWSSSYGQGWANLSNVPFRLYKRFNHEGGVSAPMIVHWPGRIRGAGQVSHQVGHLIDVMATCVDVAGARFPQNYDGHAIQPMEGKSLVPVLDGSDLGDRTLYWEHEGHRAIREGKWKLVALHDQTWELYDMSLDRTELNDLAPDYPALVDTMARKWERWAKRVHVLPPDEVQQRRKEVSRRRRQTDKQPSAAIKADPGNLASVAQISFSTPRIGRDRNAAVQDGILPRASADKETVHRSWWPEKGNGSGGNRQWAQFDFKTPRNLDRVSVYWFHDHPNGGCKVPKSWQVLYRNADGWQPVVPIQQNSQQSAFGVIRDEFNDAQFDSVTTDSLRVELQLKDGFSAGMHECRIRPAQTD